MTAIVWQRRRAAARATWREFASQRSGLVGLIGLVVIGVLAVLAPFVTDQSGLDVTRLTASPWEPPSSSNWLGTDHNGRSVLLLTWWGTRISLVVGLAATVLSVLIGTVVGITAAHFGGWCRRC